MDKIGADYREEKKPKKEQPIRLTSSDIRDNIDFRVNIPLRNTSVDK